MSNTPPAFVLDWTSTGVDVLCPFVSCKEKYHHHGYSILEEGRLNTRSAGCPRRELRYRLLFPYEDDPLVKNFGFLLDRKNMRWRTVAEEIQDPRTEKDEQELLCSNLANISISTTADRYVLESDEALLFVSECVNNNYVACKKRLDAAEYPEALVKGKNPHNGKTALSFACEEGHLKIVKLLCQYGADLDNVDNDGYTPLILAIVHGRGKTAYYLAKLGASLFIMNSDGQTVLEMAKTALKELKDLGWSRATTPIYLSGVGSTDATEQVEKRNAVLREIQQQKEGLKNLIDLYIALQPERTIHKRALAEPRNNAFSIIQTNGSQWPRVSFNKTLFETNMAKENKAFAFLDRGRPFEHIQSTAISGYTAGKCGSDDGCLDRSLWTSRVMKYCEAIGHELPLVDQYGISVPKSYHACHAEKQLMAYFLWMHTTLDRYFADSGDDDEIWGNCNEIDHLEYCKPDVASMRKDIYVSREPCPDCKLFQERLHSKTGIFFNLFFIKPITTAGSQKGIGQHS
jgi:hypothetical protein